MRQQFLRIFLRVMGSVAMLAAFAVIMPYSWMDAIHQWLGMGSLPAAPIVGYLARSTSAFYAMFGGLLWLLSFDVKRYQRPLSYLGVVIILFGATLWGVDFAEGLPPFWRNAEGPLNMFFGVVILWGSRGSGE